MAKFAIGKPVTTTEPRIDVDAGLAAGRHRFQLEVVGASGRKSAADAAIVVVQAAAPPNAIVPPLRSIAPSTPTGRNARRKKE